MTATTKSVLILATTLVLGMILGALLFGSIQRHRFRHALSLARPQHFTATLERALKPRDDAQREAIRAILDSLDGRMRNDREERAVAMRARLDSLEAHLAPILSEDQRERLHEHLTQHKGAVRRPPPLGRRMPPPGRGARAPE